MVLRTIVLFSAGKRVPLIKFRKGGYSHTGVSNQASAQTSAHAPKSAAASSNAIEDYELPRRFWRKPIDAVEMEYINRGGPA